MFLDPCISSLFERTHVGGHTGPAMENPYLGICKDDFDLVAYKSGRDRVVMPFPAKLYEAVRGDSE